MFRGSEKCRGCKGDAGAETQRGAQVWRCIEQAGVELQRCSGGGNAELQRCSGADPGDEVQSSRFEGVQVQKSARSQAQIQKLSCKSRLCHVGWEGQIYP